MITLRTRLPNILLRRESYAEFSTWAFLRAPAWAAVRGLGELFHNFFLLIFFYIDKLEKRASIIILPIIDYTLLEQRDPGPALRTYITLQLEV